MTTHVSLTRDHYSTLSSVISPTNVSHIPVSHIFYILVTCKDLITLVVPLLFTLTYCVLWNCQRSVPLSFMPGMNVGFVRLKFDYWFSHSYQISRISLSIDYYHSLGVFLDLPSFLHDLVISAIRYFSRFLKLLITESVVTQVKFPN